MGGVKSEMGGVRSEMGGVRCDCEAKVCTYAQRGKRSDEHAKSEDDSGVKGMNVMNKDTVRRALNVSPI